MSELQGRVLTMLVLFTGQGRLGYVLPHIVICGKKDGKILRKPHDQLLHLKRELGNTTHNIGKQKVAGLRQ